MVGQVILCPSCMDRVYISANLLAAERSQFENTAPASAPAQGFAADVLTSVLARMRPQGPEGGTPIGVVLAAIGGVAVLLLFAVGLIVWSIKPAKETAETMENLASAKPPSMKADIRPPTLPTPTQPAIQPTVVPPITTAPPTALARAWTLRFSTVQIPAGLTPGGPQQAGAALWPEVRRLPDLTLSADQHLTSLNNGEAGLKLSLIVVAADFATGSGVALIPETDSPTRVPAGVTDPIANMRLEGNDLLFTWAGLQSDGRVAAQLANCLLEISDGKRKQVVQFREPVRAEPIAIDLSSDKQQIETPLTNPPRTGALHLEITDLAGFPSEARLRGGVRTTGAASGENTAVTPAMTPGMQSSIQPGMASGMARGGAPIAAMPQGTPPGMAPMPQGMGPGMGMPAFPVMPISGRLTIEFPDIPGFEIHIGFGQVSGNLVVSVDPKFREGGKDDDLSLRRISQIEEDAKKPLPNAQRDLESAERSLKLWSEKLKESNANEPPSTSRRFPAWRVKHMEATRNVASFERGVADLTARIENSKSRLEVATKLRAFLKDSNKQATIHYVVYSECGETDLLLIDGRGR